MKKKTRKYCNEIAKLYGVQLTWTKSTEGWYFSGTNHVFVGYKQTDRMAISTFCHEMAHYLNFINQKYPLYHNNVDFRKYFKTKNAGARYALRAELYTDKVGKKFCKLWFPKIKYYAWYKDDKEHLDGLKKYHFGKKRP